MSNDNVPEKLRKYGASEHGNFEVVDTIGVPHPYCIGAKHVAFASNHHMGILNEYAIEQGEKNGIVCQTCKGKLKYKEHKQALLVSCKAELQVTSADGQGSKQEPNPELKAYLEASVAMCQADGYEGFAFIRGEA